MRLAMLNAKNNCQRAAFDTEPGHRHELVHFDALSEPVLRTIISKKVSVDTRRENMEWLGALLNSQPFIAVFLAIGLGFAVGNIRVAGFSLGVGAVLFVGLVIGVIAPKSA